MTFYQAVVVTLSISPLPIYLLPLLVGHVNLVPYFPLLLLDILKILPERMDDFDICGYFLLDLLDFLLGILCFSPDSPPGFFLLLLHFPSYIIKPLFKLFFL